MINLSKLALVAGVLMSLGLTACAKSDPDRAAPDAQCQPPLPLLKLSLLLLSIVAPMYSPEGTLLLICAYSPGGTRAVFNDPYNWPKYGRG